MIISKRLIADTTCEIYPRIRENVSCALELTDIQEANILLDYTHRHQALYDDHYATDWAALDDELKGAYSTLRAKDYGLEEDPPIAANDFKKPDFIRRALGLPEESDEEEVSDDGSNEVVPGGDGESSEEEINGGLGEEENVEEPSDNGVNIESPNENEGLEDSVERTPSGEELASDIDGSLKEDEASEDNDDEKSPIIFYDRDEPDNGFRDEQLLPLAIALPGATGKKAPRMSLKEFEALGFDEYPPNEWDCRLEDSKEFSTLKWYPKARLGQGACGRATLWVEVDTLNQKVFDVSYCASVSDIQLIFVADSYSQRRQLRKRMGLEECVVGY